MAEPKEANVLHFETIVENYEQLIKELNQELHEVKGEQEKLKSQLSLLLKENKNLSETVQNCINNHKPKPSSNKEENEDLVDNLRKQISSTLAEKQCVTELWQNCVKTIEYLETELKVFQAGTQEFLPKSEVQKLRVAYEEKIGHLEIGLSSTKKKLEETVKQASSELEVRHSAIDQSLETQAGAFKIIKNLETEVLKLQSRLKETNDDNVYLEKCIQNKDDIIQGLKKRNSECMAKVIEAVSVVEAALNEKDAALFREKEALEENQKLLAKLEQVTNECENKIKADVASVKNDYSEKLKDLTYKLKNVQNDLKNKTSEMENSLKKIVNLEQELQRIQSGDPNISKLLILEKNLESTFQKLLLSEKQNIQLASERDSIKNDMEQISNLYERNLKAKEIEIATLNHKIKQLQMEIDESRQQLSSVNEKMAKLNEKITSAENELKIEKGIFESKVNEKNAAKIQEIAHNYNENIKDLQEQIKSKDDNNKKWRMETKVIIQNLEKVVSNLKSEMHKLKKENVKLKEKLIKAEEKINQYKLFLELISTDVNKISNLTVGDETTVR